MVAAKVIGSDTWAGLPELDVNVGENLFHLLGADTYRLVRADLAGVSLPSGAIVVDSVAGDGVPAKVISSVIWAGLQDLDVEVGDDLSQSLDNDTFRLVRGDISSATVAALTAVIVQTSPEVGDTLTLATNATGAAAYQWTADAVAIAGATGATLDTSALSGGADIACEVSVGVQAVTTASVTLSADLAAPAFTEVPGVAGGTVLTYSSPDDVAVTQDTTEAPVTGLDATFLPSALASGPVEWGAGTLDGGTSPGDTLYFTPPGALSLDISGLQLDFEVYKGGVATGVTARVLGGDVPSGAILTYDRPTDTGDTDQIEVRGSAQDTNGTINLTTVVAEARVIPVDPPDAEPTTHLALVGVQQTVNVLGVSAGALSSATVDTEASTGTATVDSLSADSVTFTPTGAGAIQIDFTLDNNGEVDDDTLYVTAVDAWPQIAIGRTEAEGLALNAFAEVKYDDGIASDYIQHNYLQNPGPARAVGEWSGAAGDYDLTIEFQEKAAADQMWLLVDGVVEWSRTGPAGGTAWTSATASGVTLGTDAIIELRSQGTGVAWGKIDALTVASIAASVNDDFGEVVGNNIDVAIGSAGAALPSAPTAGNLILLATAAHDGVVGSSGWGDYTPIGEVGSTDGPHAMAVGYKVATGAETGDQVISLSGDYDTYRTTVVAELDGSGTFEEVQKATVEHQQGSITVSVDTGDTDRAYVIVVATYTYSTAITAWSVTAGWDQLDASAGSNNAPEVVVLGKELPSGGADSVTITATAGANTSRRWSAVAWVIRDQG